MRQELTDLVNRYAWYVDSKQPELAAGLFTPDGVLVSPDPPDVLDPVIEHVGREAISRAFADLPLTFHAVVGVVIDEGQSADEATGRIACVAHHVIGPEKDLVWHVRYADRYRFEGVWLIERRELSIDLIETRPLKRSRS